jgi:hypothetical protein
MLFSSSLSRSTRHHKACSKLFECCSILLDHLETERLSICFSVGIKGGIKWYYYDILWFWYQKHCYILARVIGFFHTLPELGEQLCIQILYCLGVHCHPAILPSLADIRRRSEEILSLGMSLSSQPKQWALCDIFSSHSSLNTNHINSMMFHLNSKYGIKKFSDCRWLQHLIHISSASASASAACSTGRSCTGTNTWVAERAGHAGCSGCEHQERSWPHAHITPFQTCI